MITQRTILFGWAGSGSAGFLIIFLFLIGPTLLRMPQFLGLSMQAARYLGVMWTDKLMLVAFIIIMTPPGILYYLRWRWKKAVNRNLPSFLRDVANAQYTGMTFIRALEHSADRDYGPLSEHLRWALAKISWGIPFEEALQAMADRIDTYLVRRAMMLIIETGRTGGDVRAIMESVAKHIKELEDLDRERATNMKTNIYIIYLGFIVMIVTVVLMYNTFIVTLIGEEFAGSLGAIRPGASPITAITYLRIYLHTSAIVAFFGGLIAGQMGEESLTNGLKHSVVMLAITLVIFIFFLAG